MGLAFEIIVEGLLRRLARFPRCVVCGRLKPAELAGVLLGLAGALLRRFRGGRLFLCLLRIFGNVVAAAEDGGISVEGMAPLFAGRFVLMGFAFEIVVEGLLRCLARFPCCVVRGRLKPAELLGVLLSPERPLLGRLRRNRRLLDLGLPPISGPALKLEFGAG